MRDGEIVRTYVTGAHGMETLGDVWTFLDLTASRRWACRFRGRSFDV